VVEGAAGPQRERIQFDLIRVSGKRPYAPLQGLRVSVRPAAGVHRRHEWPLYPSGEVVVGQQGDLVQDAPLAVGGQPADPDRRPGRAG